MKTRETTELSPATTERLQRWTNWLCDCWAPRGNNFFVVYPELAYLYLHLHTIIQPKLYDSQTVVSGFLKIKLRKYMNKSLFSSFWVYLRSAPVPSCLRTQILKLLHYRIYYSMKYDAKWQFFWLSIFRSPPPMWARSDSWHFRQQQKQHCQHSTVSAP